MSVPVVKWLRCGVANPHLSSVRIKVQQSYCCARRPESVTQLGKEVVGGDFWTLTLHSGFTWKFTKLKYMNYIKISWCLNTKWQNKVPFTNIPLFSYHISLWEHFTNTSVYTPYILRYPWQFVFGEPGSTHPIQVNWRLFRPWRFLLWKSLTLRSLSGGRVNESGSQQASIYLKFSRW